MRLRVTDLHLAIWKNPTDFSHALHHRVGGEDNRVAKASFKGKKREERSNSPSAAIVAPACSSPPPMRCDAGDDACACGVCVCERERARGRVASLCLCLLPSSPLLQSQRCGPHGSSDLLHQQIPVAVKPSGCEDRLRIMTMSYYAAKPE